jgi:thioredoxin 1
MKPTINQLKKQSGIQIAEVDVDYDAQYVPQYNVKNIPTMILLENGQEVRRSVGYKDMNQVNTFING